MPEPRGGASGPAAIGWPAPGGDAAAICQDVSSSPASAPSLLPQLQALIDELGAALDRPVLLEDAALRPLAYSAHRGQADRVRTGTLLERRAAEPVRRALMAQGIAHATGLVRIAADPRLGMEARLCVPVRHTGRTLGFVWLLGDELATEALARTQRAAAAAAAVMAGAEPAGRLLRDHGQLLAELLDPDAGRRQRAARTAVAEHGFQDGRLVVCAVAAAAPASDDVELAWSRVRRLGMRLSARHALAGPVGARCLIALRTDDPAVAACAGHELAAWLLAALPPGHGLRAGQSDAVAGLGGLAQGHGRAVAALRTAARRGVATLAWDDLGPDRILGRLAEVAPDDLPAGVRRVLGDPVLATTADCWLRHGASVAATAAALPLHRSGVYYRLGRIEALAGLDLRRGEDRLLLQLALRLHRPPHPGGGA